MAQKFGEFQLKFTKEKIQQTWMQKQISARTGGKTTTRPRDNENIHRENAKKLNGNENKFRHMIVHEDH